MSETAQESKKITISAKVSKTDHERLHKLAQAKGTTVAEMIHRTFVEPALAEADRLLGAAAG